MRLYLLPAFAVALVTASLAHGADATGTLRGVARDGAGAVLPGATVLIQRWKITDRGLGRPAPTLEPRIFADSEGRFSVKLAPDLYDVFVAYPSLSPSAKLIRVEAGRETMVECELAFSPLVKMVE